MVEGGQPQVRDQREEEDVVWVPEANVDDVLSEAMSVLEVEHVETLRPGGQKAVHRVRRGTEDFVLKLVLLGSSDPTALGRAQREVELLAQLESPYIVRVASSLIEVGEPPAAVAWLEEYLDGEDLADFLFNDWWEWQAAAEMATQVAEGLAVAHARGVVHRDLSAHNVRRRSDGSYVVMDFGFARHTLRSGLTIAGQPGTPGYLSPEHLQSYSGSPTAASDVFVVGVLMFAALTGQLPVPVGKDLDEYVLRLLRYDGVDVAPSRRDLSAGQRTLVERCLHPQPARRYLNGRRLADALLAEPRKRRYDGPD